MAASSVRFDGATIVSQTISLARTSTLDESNLLYSSLKAARSTCDLQVVAVRLMKTSALQEHVIASTRSDCYSLAGSLYE